jgi:hypothetical protein
MTRTPAATRVAIGLGALSLLAMIVSALALTDIGHGEGDLTLEWNALRICALVIVAFHVTALWALSRTAAPPTRPPTA